MHEEISIPELTEVVAHLSALLGPREGGVTQLLGGITNRNFRVNFGGTDYVVRLPGKRTELLGIDRDSERIATKAAAELGVAPRVAAMLESPPCLVTTYIQARGLSADELRQPATVEAVGKSLRAFHDSGTLLPTTFDPIDLVERYARLAGEHGGEPPDAFDAALTCARAIKSAIEGQVDHEPVPCHNDLLGANFLATPETIYLIDWEYAGMGDRWFDLGNFAVNNELSDDDEEGLLAAYFGEPPDGRRRSTLELFRFISDFREAMWGVVQTSISELDFDFAGYARKHFERLATTGSDPDFPRWVDEAAGAA